MKRQSIAIVIYALVLAVGSSLFEFFESGTFGPLTLLMSGIFVFFIWYLMRWERLSEAKQREENTINPNAFLINRIRGLIIAVIAGIAIFLLFSIL